MSGHVRRRELITLLGGAAVSLASTQPLIAREAGRTYRLGGLYLTRGRSQAKTYSAASRSGRG
jgi:hypothetical protein